MSTYTDLSFTEVLVKFSGPGSITMVMKAFALRSVYIAKDANRI